jgi:SAM-dependent methyltransferase
MTLRKFIRTRIFSRIKILLCKFEIRKYLASAAAPKINVGCGRNILKGWLNVDLFPRMGMVRLDASRRWPIPDGTFAACLCEHMIEHVSKSTAQVMIAEMFRTLRSDGVLRIVTPDLTAFARIVLSDSSSETVTYIRGLEIFRERTPITKCDAVNEIFYNYGHQYIYTPDELCRILSDAGFRDLRETRGGLYINSVFEGVDGHPRVIGQAMNEIEAFAIEARK